jgi:chemotaxis protein histidine kinase CheA/ActR/RegA family two-component response regulator
MDDDFKQDELSAEDLAILQAFDEMDLGVREVDRSEKDIPTHTPTEQEKGAEFLAPEEMLAIFVGEADEDITTIRQTLQQLDSDDHVDTALLRVLQRTAHKLKGTTGAVGCTAMSTIALHMEELVKLIANGTTAPIIGLNALVQTVHALETTLNSLVTYGEESSTPLIELEAEYKALNIVIASKLAARQAYATEIEEERGEETPVRAPFNAIVEASPAGGIPQESLTPHASMRVMRVDVERFEQLILHTEELAELSSPLESAQVEVEKALQELHTAQARLRHLEALVSAQLMTKNATATVEQNGNDERPTSSLVARILDESAQRTGQFYQRKSRFQPRTKKATDSLQWDELEIDRFTENDVLAHSLGEAIADVATASSQLRAAFAQLSRITRQHIDQATNVRDDTLLLSLAPISTLVPRIERTVMMSALAQQQRVLFEVEGETTEIDQEILEELKEPLAQLVRTCTTYGSQTTAEAGAEVQADSPHRVWLHVHAVGNEVTIEVGFSMTVGGGAVSEAQEAMRRLNGSMLARRNSLGGISFHLRLPRSQGAIPGFLVCVGRRSVVVPFTQVQRIEPSKENLAEPLYTLNSLLGFPLGQALPESARPVLILQADTSPLAVQVDAILGEVKLVVKPLAPHLQRQGIAGTAIDGMGDILLFVDLPELINHYEMLETTLKIAAIRTHGIQSHYSTQKRPSILVADDSVYIRQSLRRTLSHAGYEVREADDGMKTLERMLDRPPDALLLDVEMPNLNGYDVLIMMRVYPELAKVKTIMLTSRTSEKHRARARELGAHVFLTKPCPQDVLLETIRSLIELRAG